MTAREKIRDLLEQDFKDTEFFLVDVKQSGTKYQVFIDSDEKLSIDKCAKVSRFLENHLEAEQLVPEKYTLEVSSPGMSNPLKHIRQYQKRLGRELDLWTTENQHHRGILKEVTGNSIILEEPIKEKKKIIGTKQVQLDLDHIKKAILIFRFK
ncbi:MAG: ribosome maturation factor [Saprospiraceae bacterium]|nr:ribosome maturation factor [Saprospiraceae bacterium]